MRLEKSTIGYKLVKPKVTNDSSSQDGDELSLQHLEFISGLLRRLRNLFLSVTPSDYCAIILKGDPESREQLSENASTQDIIIKPIAYLSDELGELRYHLSNPTSREDEIRIAMLTDLFGYLVYYHLLMFEYLVTD